MAAVIKSGKGLAVKLPGYIIESLSLKEGNEVEFGMVDKTTVKMSRLENITSRELDVLRELNAIKFSERTRKAVEEKLSQSEKGTLQDLVKKKVVSFYEKGKYEGRGVYSISRDYYYLLTRKQPEELKGGYFAVDDQQKARQIMEEFKPQIQKGEILTVRSFNRKFYFVTSELVNSVGSEIVANLGENDLTIDQLSKQVGMSKDLVHAVLEILRESGDVIEKKKELYSLA